MWRWFLDLIVPPDAVRVDPDHPLFESFHDMLDRMLREAITASHLKALGIDEP